MIRFLRTLRFRRKAQPKPLELHKLPWPPSFYKTLKLHIESSTPAPRL